MATTTIAATHPAHYRHEAFFWATDEQFVAGTAPFVAEGVAQGMPVLVAVAPQRWELLRAALGDDAARVRHVDMDELGHNPARIIPAWREFVADAGGPCRGIGEPIGAGMHDARLAEAQLHEAALNAAIAPETPLWLLCPYRITELPAGVLAEAARSHPVLGVPDRSWSSPDFEDGACWERLQERPLPEPTTRPDEVAFGPRDLSAVRRLVAAQADAAGLTEERTDELVLVVGEITANSIDHGGGGGTARVWRERDALVVEVSDAGRLTDPLAGRRAPALEQARGRGLWIAHQLADLLQIRPTPTGTVLRVVTWL